MNLVFQGFLFAIGATLGAGLVLWIAYTADELISDWKHDRYMKKLRSERDNKLKKLSTTTVHKTTDKV